MRPVLFTWRGIRIYSYPAMLYVGAVLGIVASNYAANLAGLASARAFGAVVLLTLPALVGARLLFVVTHWEIYRREPSRIWRRSDGGSAMLGGLLLSLVVSVPVLMAFRVPIAPFWDVATFALLTGMAFGRVGCLLHGCCSGRPADGPFAFYLPDLRGMWRRRVPTQLLEAGLAALSLLGATSFWRHRPFEGAVFLATLGVYAGGRAILQPLRESQDRVGRLNVQQALAAVIALAALAGLLGGWLSTR